MGLALALIVMGILILLDRMGTGYGLREGWPWVGCCPWNRRAFSKQKKSCCLDYNDHRNLHLKCKILFHPHCVPWGDQDLLPTGPPDHHWPSLALAI